MARSKSSSQARIHKRDSAQDRSPEEVDTDKNKSATMDISGSVVQHVP
jgi:hypothetical protein